MDVTKRQMVLGGCGLAILVLLGLIPILQSPDPAHPLLEQLAWLSQIIVAVIAVPTAILVVQQVTQIKWTLRAESFQSTALGMQEVARLCLAHPREYTGLKSCDPLKPETELLGEAILDIVDTEILRMLSFQDPWLKTLPSLEPWFWDLFQEMPGLRATLEHRRDWYSEELYALRWKEDRPTGTRPS